MEKMSEREMMEYGENWAYTAEGIIGTLEVVLDKVEEGMADKQAQEERFVYHTVVCGLRNAIRLCEVFADIPYTVKACQLGQAGVGIAKGMIYDNEKKARILVKRLEKSR